MRTTTLLVVLLAAACSSSTMPDRDAGDGMDAGIDASFRMDAGARDSGAPDAGALDAGGDDAGMDAALDSGLLSGCVVEYFAPQGDGCFCQGPVASFGSYVYRQSLGIEVYDAADPENLVRLGSVEERPSASGRLAVLGDLLVSSLDFVEEPLRLIRCGTLQHRRKLRVLEPTRFTLLPRGMATSPSSNTPKSVRTSCAIASTRRE